MDKFASVIIFSVLGLLPAAAGSLCHPNPCEHGGTCTLTDHGHKFRCDCPYGISGDTCHGTHRCHTGENPCHPRGNCHDTDQYPFYHCTCHSGFTGANCDINSNCDRNPCKNHEVCNPYNHNPYFRCECPRGFYGHDCDYIDKCLHNPCPSGTTCHRNMSSYSCTCPSGHTCENLHFSSSEVTTVEPKAVTPVKSTTSSTTLSTTLTTHATHDHPCNKQSNCFHGRCVETQIEPYYRCDCRLGYYGNHCNWISCFPTRCHNGGTCQPIEHSPHFVCHCPPGFTGMYCSTVAPNMTVSPLATEIAHENKCSTNPCQNNGKCTETATAPYYSCTCVDGYWGSTCTHDQCYSHHCVHGRCIKTTIDPYYRCDCHVGYFGLRCSFHSCTTNSCHNGGTCQPLDHYPHYTCLCAPGYTGHKCNNKVATVALTTAVNTVTTTNSVTPVKPTTSSQTVATYGPTCLACTDVVLPNTCEYIARCGQHEICYVDSYVNSIGSIRYDLGCRDKRLFPPEKHQNANKSYMQGQITNNLCSPKKRSSSSTNETKLDDPINALICTECCAGNLCNSGGCGTTGFPTLESKQRGPICSHCDQQTSPGDCNKIKVCGRDERCVLEKTSVGTSQQSLYRTDCEIGHPCNWKLYHTLPDKTVVCRSKCCTTDFCTSHC